MGYFLYRHCNNEEGQSLVEMALVLPFLLLILLGIVQFGFVFSGQIALSSAAREGARLAATGAANLVVRERVEDMLAASPLLSDVQVVIVPEGAKVFGGQVRIQVSAGCPVIMPLPVVLTDGVFSLSAEAVMRVENVAGGSENALQIV
ncbi:MAG: TadE family protein [Bacillota bacterium]